MFGAVVGASFEKSWFSKNTTDEPKLRLNSLFFALEIESDMMDRVYSRGVINAQQQKTPFRVIDTFPMLMKKRCVICFHKDHRRFYALKSLNTLLLIPFTVKTIRAIFSSQPMRNCRQINLCHLSLLFGEVWEKRREEVFWPEGGEWDYREINQLTWWEKFNKF